MSEQVFLSNVSNLHGQGENAPIPGPPPVVGVEIYRNDARLIRASQPYSGGGKRQKCTEISAASIKNAKHVIANSDPVLPSIITLTYPDTYPSDGRIVKAHFRALKERLRRKFGDFSYFAAQEYQQRGAPHLHIAISIDLRDLGEITQLRRGDGKRPTRRPSAYDTHKPSQDWLWRAWLEIISDDAPRHDWWGITDKDAEMMNRAYFCHNSATTWEIMRKDDGAKRYLVKELSSLKVYQKSIPEDFDNPGRHFLYSPDMKPTPVMTIAVTGAEIRAILEALDWKWLPPPGRPLFRDLWNVAAEIITALLQTDVQVIDADRLDYLRQYSDVRCLRFMDVDMSSMAAWTAETSRLLDSEAYWAHRQRVIGNQIDWEQDNWGESSTDQEGSVTTNGR